MKKIVVLGGGIAGIEATIFLRKYNFDVELISDRDYLFVYPISIWLPTKEKNFNDVIIPIEKLSKIHRFKFTKDKVIKVNKDGFVLEKNGERKDYDYLVVAIGQEKFKHKDIECTYSICGNPEEIISYTKKLEDNKVKDCENIYAIGDCVSLEGPEWKAKQGHLAEVMARNTAFNIALKEGLEKENPKTYIEHINILCLMDMGNGGKLAYRNNKKATLITLPIIGHWIKKSWGHLL